MLCCIHKQHLHFQKFSTTLAMLKSHIYCILSDYKNIYKLRVTPGLKQVA